MYAWGPVSKANYQTLHRKLQTIADRVLEYRDATITEGHRNADRQNHLFNTGKSKVRWPDSKHNAYPSRGMDLLPYPFKPEWWSVKEHWDFWVQWGSFVVGVAAGLGIRLRWGFDWDQDFDLKDQTFYDGPHFELDESEE